MKDLLPVLPVGHTSEVVGAHQPDETIGAKLVLETLQRVGGIASAKTHLEIADTNARMRRNPFGLAQARGEGRHVATALQGILRGHQPPHLVEAEIGEGCETDVAMAFMGGVEGTAEQADLAGNGGGHA